MNYLPRRDANGTMSIQTELANELVVKPELLSGDPKSPLYAIKNADVAGKTDRELHQFIEAENLGKKIGDFFLENDFPYSTTHRLRWVDYRDTLGGVPLKEKVRNTKLQWLSEHHQRFIESGTEWNAMVEKDGNIVGDDLKRLYERLWISEVVNGEQYRIGPKALQRFGFPQTLEREKILDFVKAKKLKPVQVISARVLDGFGPLVSIASSALIPGFAVMQLYLDFFAGTTGFFATSIEGRDHAELLPGYGAEEKINRASHWGGGSAWGRRGLCSPFEAALEKNNFPALSKEGQSVFSFVWDTYASPWGGDIEEDKHLPYRGMAGLPGWFSGLFPGGDSAGVSASLRSN